MQIEEVELQKNSQKFIILYTNLFSRHYSAEPELDMNRSMEIARWAVKKMGWEKASGLLSSYFDMENEWVREKAYPLQWFKDNINEVIAAQTEYKKDQKQWVVAISESGLPVISSKQFEMGKSYYYKPRLLDEWVKLSLEEKLFNIPIEKWRAGNNEVDLWIRNWMEWGYLLKTTDQVQHDASF